MHEQKGSRLSRTLSTQDIPVLECKLSPLPLTKNRNAISFSLVWKSEIFARKTVRSKPHFATLGHPCRFSYSFLLYIFLFNLFFSNLFFFYRASDARLPA